MLIYSTFNLLKTCAQIRALRVGEPPKQVVFAESSLEHVGASAKQPSQFGVDNALISALQVGAEVQPLDEQRILWRG